MHSTLPRPLTPLDRLALVGVRLYQQLAAPWRLDSCRFVPSCSSYAAEAIVRFGWRHGGWLTAHRLLRCHPFASAGPDPVPAVAAQPPCRVFTHHGYSPTPALRTSNPELAQAVSGQVVR